MRVTLYVLTGKASRRRYVGITSDLQRRLRERASGATQAGRVVGEFEVLHIETLADHREARAREKFLKSGQGRKWLDELEAQTWLARGE